MQEVLDLAVHDILVVKSHVVDCDDVLGIDGSHEWCGAVDVPDVRICPIF
jgi:hypothetical protein